MTKYGASALVLRLITALGPALRTEAGSLQQRSAKQQTLLDAEWLELALEIKAGSAVGESGAGDGALTVMVGGRSARRAGYSATSGTGSRHAGHRRRRPV